MVVPRVPRILAAAATGIGATGVDVALLAACVSRGAPVGVAAFVGAVAGAGVAFGVGKRWAFGDRGPARAEQVVRFAAVAGATAVLMALAMTLAVDGLGAPYLGAKLACSAAVFAGWSYPAQRRFVFATAASPRRRPRGLAREAAAADPPHAVDPPDPACAPG